MKKFFLPQIHITFERWKFNSAHKVFVSTQGRVKDEEGNLLEQSAHCNYLHVSNGLGAAVPVHRLVIETFKPNHKEEENSVDHKDSNTRNNTLKNLAWMTKRDNENKAIQAMEKLIEGACEKKLKEKSILITRAPGTGKHNRRHRNAKLNKRIREKIFVIVENGSNNSFNLSFDSAAKMISEAENIVPDTVYSKMLTSFKEKQNCQIGNYQMKFVGDLSEV